MTSRYRIHAGAVVSLAAGVVVAFGACGRGADGSDVESSKEEAACAS
jgi:hypothetical protein